MERKHLSAHIISHSHWDREWYMTLEEHRYYLIQLMDDLIEISESDPNFHSFHMDGQTIMIEDYLAVRPEKKAIVEKLLRAKKWVIGPWYILQDAFLTSEEANVRNLIYGIMDARAYGQDQFMGYYPDTFGIYGQAPQLMKQVGIDVAAFGRGVTPTGFNNTVKHDPYSSQYSELCWQSPDGTQVLGILFANWYSNGNEIPVDQEQAQQFWDKKLEEAKRFSSTGELLFMNGCDHQPLQKNISQAIEQANLLYPDVNFLHTDFVTYAQKLKKRLPKDLQTIEGELRNQKTDGWSSLVNTASSRVKLKILNDECEQLLETKAEPLGWIAEKNDQYKDFVRFYWKSLMKNHPHDSICGCSTDGVHREMYQRFESVRDGVNRWVDETFAGYCERLKEKGSEVCEGAIPIVLMNTLGETFPQVHTLKVPLLKIYFDQMPFGEIPQHLSQKKCPSYVLENSRGEIIPVEISSPEVVFGYDLPSDGFRKPYYALEAKVTFLYQPWIQWGHEVYHLKVVSEVLEQPQNIGNEQRGELENEWIKVKLNANGSYTLTDKSTGALYENQGLYCDEGDIGNAYMFKASGDSELYCSESLKVQWVWESNSQVAAEVKAILQWELPASADETLLKEQKELVWHPHRKAQRSEEKIIQKIETRIKLEKNVGALKIKTHFNNQVKDHRLKVRFTLDEKVDHHYADSVFEVAKRSNSPEQEWENPSFDHHCRRFFSMGEEKALTVVTKGLHEYRIDEDQKMYLTLLRSTGEMGDWGYFPTPEGQCLGEHEVEYALIPHRGNIMASGKLPLARSLYKLALAQTLSRDCVIKNKIQSYFSWEGNGLILTAVKLQEKGEGKIIRWYNPQMNAVTLKLQTTFPHRIFSSNLLEEKGDNLGEKTAEYTVKPLEIITLLLEEGDQYEI